MRLASLMAIEYEAGLFQQTQVLRYGRLRDAGLGGQRRNGLFAVVAQVFEKGAPGGIGKGPEEQVLRGGHGLINNHVVMNKE
ncbi:hypothetical protein GCM10009097_24480 [Pigmentiphaga daeguensis]|uniref:Uncharacterized protein n=1 Tax=Pigmentiphaga daeguensis TaxID=414049 RepID=A0ABN1BVG9_9BURK